MQRCLQLAKKGIGNVSPNPLVGCVIVCKDKIIGEGYHQKYGEKHAEVNAIESVKDKNLLKNSTLFVNLEPCSHWGKTPPCCELIVKNKIKHVVIGCLDSSEKVNGKGIDYLNKNGVEVTIDVLKKKKCIWINRRFFENQIKNKPYIILKWAQTQDGFIDKKREKNKTGINWITSNKTKVITHQWRKEEDAILVGRKTVENDNPELTVREVTGINPIRIVLDPELKLNSNYKVFNNQAKTIVVNHKNSKIVNNIEYLKTEKKSTIEELLKNLNKKKIGSLIVEGGAETLNYFIQNNLWNEARILIGDKKFKVGTKAPTLNKKNRIISSLNQDQLHTIYND
jgi:diaminohydroxyphosphoribosylaminopyrimidine deaminase/5-amino-6-(5-phosphoribosylamino)uracil reductase